MGDEFDPVTHPRGYCARGGIEPIEFLMSNNVPCAEANIIKYVFRWRFKDGVRDLYKAREYLARLIKQAEAEGANDGASQRPTG